MKKVLIITNTASMVHLFNSVNIGAFQDEGFEVHIACNFIHGNTASKEAIEDFKKEWRAKGIISHHIEFLRSPFSLKSFEIYKQTKKLIEEGNYDLIHCHTPIVSVFTRLAVSRMKGKKPKLVYTAHGFHFYDGCPLFNWLIYYPIEKIFAPHTDLLITMNKEDHERAKKSLKARRIEFINGVGINATAINETEVDREGIREMLSIGKDQLLMISVGEVNQNKNHKTAIKALSMCKVQNLHYVIAGVGHIDETREFARHCGVEDRVHFLGFRSDVYRILKACDIFVFPSFREGLSVALTEAMACSLPVVASQIRGNVDLIDDKKGGFLCKPDDAQTMSDYIDQLASDPELREKMGNYNYRHAQKYDKNLIIKRLMNLILDRPDDTEGYEDVETEDNKVAHVKA